MPIWSKLKRSVEALLAESVKGRLQFYITRYGPGESTIMTRAWITWDGQEIMNFSSIQWLEAQQALVAQIQAEGGASTRAAVSQDAKEVLEAQGVYSQWDFSAALAEYITLSIDEALSSPHLLIRAWALFDRRLGKKRLRAMQLTERDPAFVHHWYQLRCQAEGIAHETQG
jgi:hypothetical protein